MGNSPWEDVLCLDRIWSSGAERYRYSTQRDLEPIGAMLSDAAVARWLWFAPISADDATAYFRPLVDRQRDRLAAGALSDAVCFTVENAATDRFIGQGAVVAVPGSVAGYEIGFQLCVEAWRKGVGTRLSRFLCRFAIDVLDAYRIEGACLEGNVASAKLLRNLGLDLEATLVDYRLRDGTRHTELRFGRRVRDLVPPVEWRDASNG